jgi:hypothetical protein
MSAWAAHLMDVHGAFLKGKFRDGEVIYNKDSRNTTKKMLHYYCYEQFMDWFKQHWLFGERQSQHSYT